MRVIISLFLLSLTTFSIEAYAQLASSKSIIGKTATVSSVSITAGGQAVELHGFPGGSFGIFPLSHPLSVVIYAAGSTQAIVRPLSAHISPSISADHQTIQLTLSDTTPITVEVNGDKTNVVHLFPFAPQGNQPARGSKVQYFGPGIITAGIIRLQPGDTLYLAPGAWVKGLVRARFAAGISILGAGVLDASDYTDPRAAPFGNNDAIDLEDSPNAKINGITIFNSHNWTIHLRHSDGTKVDSVKVLNPGNWVGNDGIDVDSSSHVTISHVFIRTNDDCIAIKNTVNVDTSNIQVANSVLWNESRGGNGLEIGYETGAMPIHDVDYSNIDLIHVEHGAALSIHNVGSNIVQNVSYRNINVEDVRNRLFDFAVFFSTYSPDRGRTSSTSAHPMVGAGPWNGSAQYPIEQHEVVASNRGQISHVTVQNLNVLGPGRLPPSLITGFDNTHVVSGISVRGLVYNGHPVQSGTVANIREKFASNVLIQ